MPNGAESRSNTWVERQPLKRPWLHAVLCLRHLSLSHITPAQRVLMPALVSQQRFLGEVIFVHHAGFALQHALAFAAFHGE